MILLHNMIKNYFEMFHGINSCYITYRTYVTSIYSTLVLSRCTPTMFKLAYPRDYTLYEHDIDVFG